MVNVLDNVYESELIMDSTEISKNKLNDHKILIVDDYAMNRQLLTEILESKYSIIQAEDGAQALELLEKERNNLLCVLLDLNMDNINGYEVLEIMQKKKWLEKLPVVVISSENNPSLIKKAYSLGAIDFIERPFDMEIVSKRVSNVITLYSKQNRLAQMVITQHRENERISNLMVSLLGHIVEFRNKESGEHIQNVSVITNILLNKLVNKTKKYNLNSNDIKLITQAAALHDVGKIAISESILNKPGKLTSEEFDIMKKHTVLGGEMIKSCKTLYYEPIIQTAYKIVCYHHERYDGKGYPEGLVGDKIPIEAQVVALADVYDALTSVRCYKKAFTHEKAINMILTGECGTFNPLLITVLSENAENFPQMIMQTKQKNEQKIYG